MRDGNHMLVLVSRERNGVYFPNILLMCICYNKQYEITMYDKTGQVLVNFRFIFYRINQEKQCDTGNVAAI